MIILHAHSQTVNLLRYNIVWMTWGSYNMQRQAGEIILLEECVGIDNEKKLLKKKWGEARQICFDFKHHRGCVGLNKFYYIFLTSAIRRATDELHDNKVDWGYHWIHFTFNLHLTIIVYIICTYKINTRQKVAWCGTAWEISELE